MMWFAMLTAAFVGGIIQRMVGFGSGVLMMLVSVQFFDMAVAPSLALSISLFLSALVAIKYRKFINWRQILPLIAVFGLSSIVIIRLLGNMDLGRLHLSFGIFLILLSANFLFFSSHIHLKPNLATGLICSAISGCCNGVFGTGGPPMAMYMVTVNTDKDEYAANIQFLFLITDIIAFTARVLSGYYAVSYLPLTFAGAALILAGCYLGERLSRRISGEMLRKVVYIGVGISGIVTVIQQL